MARALRLPGLVDILRTDDPAEVLALAADPRLDRGFGPLGPVFNLALAHRLRTILEVDGRRLPATSPRAAPGRAARQAALEAALAPAPGRPAPWAEADLAALAAWVRGTGAEADLGPLAQGVVGRAFVPGYAATAETWAAARLLDAAPRAANPLRLLLWQLSGRLWRARRLLAAAVGGDLAGVHATGLAVHSLARGFAEMRAVLATPGLRETLTEDAALARCLLAPATVLRQASAPGVCAAGELRPGTLVVLELEAARRRAPGPGPVFLTHAWARCPAHAWVPALMRAVWRHAAGANGGRAVP